MNVVPLKKTKRKMNILSIVLIVIGVLIALPLIVALFVKKDYRIEEQVSVARPLPAVFAYVKLLDNQQHFNKWVMADPTMKKTLTGTDGTVGFIYAWNSTDKNVGEGEQEIKAVTESTLNTEIRFVRPFQGIAYVTIATDSISAQETRIRWIMEGRAPYPINITNLFTGKILHADMQLSLQNLKKILENK